MTAEVKCFAHSAVVPASVVPGGPGGSRYSADSVQMLKQPYMARETLSPTTGSAASSSSSLAPSGANLLRVQIEVGKTVYIEVNYSGREGGEVTATSDSPSYSGDVTLEWGPGRTLSVLEAS